MHGGNLGASPLNKNLTNGTIMDRTFKCCLRQLTFLVQMSNTCSIKPLEAWDLFGTVFLRQLLRGHKEMSSIWLTNSTLVYEPKYGGGGGLRGLTCAQ